MQKNITAFAIFLIIPFLAQSQPDSLQERNKDVIRQQIEHSNSHDLQASVSDWSDDMKNFGLPGRDILAKAYKDIWTTFPDFRFDLIDMMAEGEYVVIRAKVSGTHLGVGKLPVNGGMLIGVEPTKKHFVVDHIHWYKLKGGKIVEHWATRDDLGMMRQLGLLPPIPQLDPK